MKKVNKYNFATVVQSRILYIVVVVFNTLTQLKLLFLSNFTRINYFLSRNNNNNYYNILALI